MESDSLGEGVPHHPSIHTECQAGPSTPLHPPAPSRRSNKVGAQVRPSFQLTSFLTFLCSGRLSKMSLCMQPEHRGSEHLTHRSGRVPRLPRLSLSLSLVDLHLQVGCRVRYLLPSLKPPAGGKLGSQRLARHFWSPHSQRGRGEKRAPPRREPHTHALPLVAPRSHDVGK